MNSRDQDLFTASRLENSGTPEERARTIRIRAREAQLLARERQWDREDRARETAQPQRGRAR